MPVVPIGKITSDVGVFEEYGDGITIEIVESMGNVPDSGSGIEKSAGMPDNAESR